MTAAAKEAVVHEVATISLDAAQRLLRTAFELARTDDSLGDAIACAVVGGSGELVAFAAHDDCSPLARTLAGRKALTAAILRRTTAAVRAATESGQLSLAQIGDPHLVTMLGGAPLIVDGRVVGAIGVSGLPPEDDARLADAMATQFGGFRP